MEFHGVLGPFRACRRGVPLRAERNLISDKSLVFAPNGYGLNDLFNTGWSASKVSPPHPPSLCSSSSASRIRSALQSFPAPVFNPNIPRTTMLFSALFASLPLLSAALYTPSPSHSHVEKRALPQRWYQDEAHPVHSLFRRATDDGEDYPAVGTPSTLLSLPSTALAYLYQSLVP